MEIVSNEVLEESWHTVSFDLARVVHIEVLPGRLKMIANNRLCILSRDVHIILQHLCGCFLSAIPLEPEIAVWLTLGLSALHGILGNNITHEIVTSLSLVSLWQFSVSARWETWLVDDTCHLEFVIADVECGGVWWDVLPVILGHLL